MRICLIWCFVQGNCTDPPSQSGSLPLDSLDPPLLQPWKQGQCVLLFGDTVLPGPHEVDVHILQASEPDAEPFWMENLHLRRTGSSLKYIFVRADRRFYMTSVVLGGNAKKGPQAVRVTGGVRALIAGAPSLVFLIIACMCARALGCTMMPPGGRPKQFWAQVCAAPHGKGARGLSHAPLFSEFNPRVSAPLPERHCASSVCCFVDTSRWLLRVVCWQPRVSILITKGSVLLRLLNAKSAGVHPVDGFSHILTHCAAMLVLRQQRHSGYLWFLAAVFVCG
jgi:hypothetical protein